MAEDRETSLQSLTDPVRPGGDIGVRGVPQDVILDENHLGPIVKTIVITVHD